MLGSPARPRPRASRLDLLEFCKEVARDVATGFPLLPGGRDVWSDESPDSCDRLTRSGFFSPGSGWKNPQAFGLRREPCPCCRVHLQSLPDRTNVRTAHPAIGRAL